jgi:hypothetical protein
VHKVQISSALAFAADPEQASREAREAFVEPRFLHQTRIQDPQGVRDYDDLPEALDDDSAWQHPWRTHYHLPIELDRLENGFGTTSEDWRQAVSQLLLGSCQHFEVETYTWNVLPEPLRPKNEGELAECLTRELRCVLEAFPDAFTVSHQD